MISKGVRVNLSYVTLVNETDQYLVLSIVVFIEGMKVWFRGVLNVGTGEVREEAPLSLLKLPLERR